MAVAASSGRLTGVDGSFGGRISVSKGGTSADSTAGVRILLDPGAWPLQTARGGGVTRRNRRVGRQTGGVGRYRGARDFRSERAMGGLISTTARAADNARPSRASVSVVSVIRFLLVLCSQWTGDIQEVVSHQIDKRPVLLTEPSGVDVQLFLGQRQL